MGSQYLRTRYQQVSQDEQHDCGHRPVTTSGIARELRGGIEQTVPTHRSSCVGTNGSRFHSTPGLPAFADGWAEKARVV